MRFHIGSLGKRWCPFHFGCTLQGWEFGQQPCFLPSGQKLPVVGEKKGNYEESRDKDRWAVLYFFCLEVFLVFCAKIWLWLSARSLPILNSPSRKFLLSNTHEIKPTSWPQCHDKHLFSYPFGLLFLEFYWAGWCVQVWYRSGHLFFDSKPMALMPWTLWRHDPNFPFLEEYWKKAVSVFSISNSNSITIPFIF